jgi:WD40 repeat protein
MIHPGSKRPSLSSAQVKIWKKGNTGEWKAVVTIKTSTAATAVDFAPGSDKHKRVCSASFSSHYLMFLDRRRLAIGLETGEILIYSNSRAASSPDWRQDSVITSQFVKLNLDEKNTDSAARIAHVNHIQRLAWQPTLSGTPTTLASSSEDGTLKILIVPTVMD